VFFPEGLKGAVTAAGRDFAMNRKMGYLTFIIASLRNKPGRNLATIFCFAFIAANVFSAQYLISGASGSFDQGINRMGADLMVVPAQYQWLFRGSGAENTGALVRVEPIAFRFTTGTMDTMKNVRNISKMSPQVYVAKLSVPDLSSSPVYIYGIDSSTDFTIQPWLQQPLSHPLNSGEVIIGNALSAERSSNITVSDHTYTIAGKLDPTQSTVDQTVFFGMEDAYILAATEGIIPSSDSPVKPGEISAVMVQVVPGADSGMVSSRIRQPSNAIMVIQRHFTLNPTSRDVQGLPAILKMISAVVIVAALPLIALIAAMVTSERQREIGLFMSMGAKRGVIFSLVIVESLVLAAIGGIAGAVASLVVFNVLNANGFLTSALQVSFRMPSATGIAEITAITLIIVLTIGSIASFWPAYRSSIMNPYDAIRGTVR
jgi:putative ABC transport system permease protein